MVGFRLSKQRLTALAISLIITLLAPASVALACEGGGEEFNFQMSATPRTLKGAGSTVVAIENTSGVSGTISSISPEKGSGEWSWAESLLQACKGTYAAHAKCSWTVTYGGISKSTLTYLAKSTNLQVHGTMVEGEP
jgi:hypothetical protein